MPRKSTSPRRKTSPKKRGRPRKSTSPRRKTSPKKRGRPRKSTSPRRKTSPKKRGRPRKTSPRRRTTARTMKYDGKRRIESLMDAANEYRDLDNPVLSHAAGLVYDDYYLTDTEGFSRDEGGLNPEMDTTSRYSQEVAKQTVLNRMIDKISKDEIYTNEDLRTRAAAISEANQISKRLQGMRRDSL